MRFSDGPAVEVSVHVAAPPGAVWPLVRDIATPARFSAELQGTRWLDERRFTGRSRHERVGEWETTCTVVADVPEREFAWAVGDPERPAARWRFVLEPDGDGTRLRQEARLGPGESGLTAAIARRPDAEEKIVERRLAEHRANMTATVEGIKALAEGGTPASA